VSNDSWDWPGAFEAAGKHQAEHPEATRLSRVLKPEEFARALRSMWTEHGMIERSDPRVQEISRTGRLEWWDGRGRQVVLVREGAKAGAPDTGGLTPEQITEGYVEQKCPHCGVTTSGHRLVWCVACGKGYAQPPPPLEMTTPAGLTTILGDQSRPAGAPPLGVDLGPPKVELREETKAEAKPKGKRK